MDLSWRNGGDFPHAGAIRTAIIIVETHSESVVMRRGDVMIMIVAAVMVLYPSRATAGFTYLYLNDGAVHNIDYTIKDVIWVDLELPGIKTTVNILEGAAIPQSISSYADSIINISGGRVDHLACYDNSQANITGGSTSITVASGASQINVFSEFVNYVYAVGAGTTTIYGSDFALDGVPVGYTELTAPMNIGELTGTLINGDAFKAICGVFGEGRVVLVPEPGTLLMVGLAGLTLLRKRGQG